MGNSLKIKRVCFYGSTGKAFITTEGGDVYMISIHDFELKQFNRDMEMTGDFMDCITIIKGSKSFNAEWIKKTLVLETKKQHAFAMAVVAMGIGFGQDVRISCLKDLDKLLTSKKIGKFLRKKFPACLQDKEVLDVSIDLAHQHGYAVVENFLKKIRAEIA